MIFFVYLKPLDLELPITSGLYSLDVSDQISGSSPRVSLEFLFHHPGICYLYWTLHTDCIPGQLYSFHLFILNLLLISSSRLMINFFIVCPFCIIKLRDLTVFAGPKRGRPTGGFSNFIRPSVRLHLV